jgi:BirA family transcriptional regulator, biotin operon repressor / biotin---[acetyl-CoA-carboxylase] ligase
MIEATPALPEGYRLFAFDTLGSTNDEAKRLAHAGAAAGTLVWAREQTAGHGRRGRAWASPPGNLYLSLIMRPQAPPARAAQLGFVAALGLGDALLALTEPALGLRYKWPNDLLADGRKLAGILLEAEAGGAEDGVDFVVIGIGVNLASAPRDVEYPATSLAAAGYTDVSPGTLLAEFARHFERRARRWQVEGFAPVRDAWLERASGIGEPVRVRLDRGTLHGRFVDLDADGALLLDAADGPRRIAAGDIFPALG